MISLINLLWIFVVDTVITFGNGPVILPLLNQSLVQQLHVISSDQLLYAYAIGRVTPGQVNLYIAAVGYFLFGPVGAVLSSISIILPGFLMIPMVAWYEKFHKVSIINNLIKGITVVSIGLIFTATVAIGQDVLKGVNTWIVFLSVIVFNRVFKINGFLSFIAGSVLGIAIYFFPLHH
ncbi:MAG TPA: chromate transporter [Patescibacteria group bacterium]|nr:chromate transporter [Patescibacteria group bacterium]